MSRMLFDYLIVGLDKLQRQQSSYYPYPTELKLAMNQLAKLLGDKHPKTFPALLDMLENPIGEWLDGIDLPTPLISEAPLLYRRQLDDMAIQYLEDHKLNAVGSFIEIQSTQENSLMLELIAEARRHYAIANTDEDRMEVEKAYTDARRFLVENPVTLRQKFKQTFRFHRYKEKIWAMYDKIEDVHHLAYEAGNLLICQECGPIHETASGTQDSLKPSACKGRCPTRTGWDRQALNVKNRFVLKRAIQERTMIPGKAEIDLYKTLARILEAQEEMILTQVRLYPAIDQYDLQLRFEFYNREGEIQEEVWAVDVKDYHIPQVVGNKVKSMLDESLYRAFPNYLPKLEWHRAFYVVPDYREVARNGYCNEFCIACQSDRFHKLDIMTSSEFIHSVEHKIWENTSV